MATKDLKPTTTIKLDRQVAMVRYSPCGRFLCAAGRDGLVHRWKSAVSEKQPADSEQQPEVSEKQSATGTSDSGVKLPPLTGHNGWVTGLAFVPGRPHLVTADSWGQILCWQYDDDAPRRLWGADNRHDGWVRQIAVSSDGQHVASCGADQAIRIWSTDDGRLIKELRGNEDLFSVAFHPNAHSVVSGDLRGKVCDWDWNAGVVRRELDAQILYLLSYIQDVGGVRVLRFDEEGKVLAVAGGQPSTGGFVQASPIIRFFNWEDGQEIRTVKLGENTEGYVLDLQYHSRRFWAGVCSGQPGRGRYFFLRVGEEAPFQDKQLPNCHSLALHPNGSRIAVVANEGTFGQRKSMAREGIYPGNTSPIHLIDLPDDILQTGSKENASPQ